MAHSDDDVAYGYFSDYSYPKLVCEARKNYYRMSTRTRPSKPRVALRVLVLKTCTYRMHMYYKPGHL
eukprot:scaffold422868_cov22-Prasinocladus_malaysianus.AAC.1